MNPCCFKAICCATALTLLGLGTQTIDRVDAFADDRATIEIDQAQRQSTGRRVALVIGNANYQTISSLRNPANDATDMANALRGVGFEVILVIDANLEAMQNSLRQFDVAIQQGSVGVFYFAGHGVQYEGENYLIPIDASLQGPQDLDFDALQLAAVLDRMRDANNDANIVILDACRNNPFPGSQRNGQRGLATVQAARGFYIAYATAPGSVADDGTGRNGTFTSALLRHINTPGIPIEQMFKQVRSEVDRATSGRQIPWDASSLIGNFAFNNGQASRSDTGAPALTDAPIEPPALLPDDDIVCGASICLY